MPGESQLALKVTRSLRPAQSRDETGATCQPAAEYCITFGTSLVQERALRHSTASRVVRTNDKGYFNTFTFAREMTGSPSPSLQELNVAPGMMDTAEFRPWVDIPRIRRYMPPCCNANILCYSG